MASPKNWKFSIDVGGTFTDCVATDPRGETRWTKVLSSGVTKGEVASRTGSRTFADPRRAGDGDGLWSGYQIDFIGADPQDPVVVVAFASETGSFTLSADLPADVREGVSYELSAAEPAPILAIRRIVRQPLTQPLPQLSLRLGSTRGTNALLTRQGSRTALLTTEGFGDVLEIGEQNRPELFDLSVRKHRPLYDKAIEISERILADGTVEQAPRQSRVVQQLRQLSESGVESIAICLMHGYRYPQHEHRVAEWARQVGFKEISLSSEIAPLIKIVPRAETTVLDAYLNPVLRTYLLDLIGHLPVGSDLRLMTSAGGLVPPERFSGRDSLLSGPAGGVVGFAEVARRQGFSHAIGFDMGGTSTDVSRYDGEYEKQYETYKAGVRIVTPTMAIETVAAGGGSICKFDGTRLIVGPESAGAIPGPACYGRGGPLCVTDLNVFLGRIVPQQFPFPLNLPEIRVRLQELIEDVHRQTGIVYGDTELAEGLLRVANTNMAAAVRAVSVARGFDPRDYVLVAYGGAASQHMCSVAQQLGITRTISHPHSGLLSAVGIALASPSSNQVIPCAVTMSNLSEGQVQDWFTTLQERTHAELIGDGYSAEDIQCRRLLDLKYRDTQTAITVHGSGLTDFRNAFVQQHRREFGYTMDREIDVVAARVEASVRAELAQPEAPIVRGTLQHSSVTQGCVFQGESLKTPVFKRSELRAGDRVSGPALVYDEFSCAVVDPGWTGVATRENVLVLEESSARPMEPESQAADEAAHADPIQLEVFNNHFTSIATQMGEMLRKTAISVNAKERLDYSCAIFTEHGELVVNAPHIPVHLGAMSQTVRETIRLNEVISDGDVFVTNDPFLGGSHLPDVTVITPVFVADRPTATFFVASRCHHAEIGGIAAGSMSPYAKLLSEEGVLISNFRLLREGKQHFEELRRMLTEADYPSRSPDENLADIAAQVAANRRGAAELIELVLKFSLPVVERYMLFIQQAAEFKVRQALARLPEREMAFEDRMDCGARICAAIRKVGDGLQIDFSGTDPIQPNNLNANSAIVTAAVLYTLRCLIDEEIPLNQGILMPVDLVLPDCFINPVSVTDATQAPAVAGGNVETSQRIVDVLLGALNLSAASQGTMNNLMVGDATFGYYETICGGAGATADCPGAHAVHTHMTNTRLTDPEILETRFPMILRRFAIRQDSGGHGQLSGGNGVLREIEFCRFLEVTVMSNRRLTSPYGLAGGRPGSPGRNLWIRANGATVDIGPEAQIQVSAGDRLRIETPGGGGWGPAQE